MEFNKAVLFFLFMIFISCTSKDDEVELNIDETATYIVVFDAAWTEESHPTDYPSDSHFSWMVGVTHKQNDLLFSLGGIASNGIEQMAETGLTELISEEIENAISQDMALDYKVGSVINGNGIDEIIIDASIENSLFSFVSMIAPSPDWFVSNQNIQLIQNQDWIETLELDVILYDSGTDSGTEFTSLDIDTNPREPITLITTEPLGNGVGVTPSLGKIILTKL
ncbi:spondin domain-containing protein [Urechidicola croceus]|uniref:Spondin domain-containing protein n=1 Tax=Urechidicola croceus TaxID=1850246 RepID=A0A1D8PA58_9FLAO|nr:spondin domain-containing protein [Urechidicola croceus]AOW21462.1 hypothetical protein LPB138_12575 [Urechidicola croceus]